MGFLVQTPVSKPVTRVRLGIHPRSSTAVFERHRTATPATPYDEAECSFDRAISSAEATPNIRFPIMAYLGKSETLPIPWNAEIRSGIDNTIRRSISKPQAQQCTWQISHVELAQRRFATRKRIQKPQRLSRAGYGGRQEREHATPISAAQFNPASSSTPLVIIRRPSLLINRGARRRRAPVDSYVLPRQLALGSSNCRSPLKDDLGAASYYERAQDVI